MTTPGRTTERIVPRRRFLQQGAALAAGAETTAIGSLATMNLSSVAGAPTSQIAGIDPGRIVAEMRDRQLDSLSDTDLYRAIDPLNAGDEVLVTAIRGGKEFQVKVKLAVLKGDSGGP